jgi:hypothetical protein
MHRFQSTLLSVEAKQFLNRNIFAYLNKHNREAENRNQNQIQLGSFFLDASTDVLPLPSIEMMLECISPKLALEELNSER